MPIRNQIEAVTQLLTEQPTFIYGTVNESRYRAAAISKWIITPYTAQKLHIPMMACRTAIIQISPALMWRSAIIK
jgi:hypothetical protein